MNESPLIELHQAAEKVPFRFHIIIPAEAGIFSRRSGLPLSRE
jgi:hypothetical protein